MKIDFFDFDGTITTRDSCIVFLIYATGCLNFIAGRFILRPSLLAFTGNFIPKWRAKEIVLSHFLIQGSGRISDPGLKLRQREIAPDHPRNLDAKNSLA